MPLTWAAPSGQETETAGALTPEKARPGAAFSPLGESPGETLVRTRPAAPGLPAGPAPGARDAGAVAPSPRTPSR